MVMSADKEIPSVNVPMIANFNLMKRFCSFHDAKLKYFAGLGKHDVSLLNLCVTYQRT